MSNRRRLLHAVRKSIVVVTTVALGATSLAILPPQVSSPASADPPAAEPVIVARSSAGIPWTSSSGSGTAQLTYAHRGCGTPDANGQCSGGVWANIPGASWIWATKDSDFSRLQATFTQTFHSAAGPALLRIAADNAFSATLNGTQIASATEYSSVSNVAANLQAGTNTLVVAVTNGPDPQNSYDNPAGAVWSVGTGLSAADLYGGVNLANPNSAGTMGCAADPVHTGTGNFWRTWDDIAVPGRGVPLSLSRTYNSLAASNDSAFGYGWSFNYGSSIAISGNTYTIKQENGSQVVFTKTGSVFSAPPRINATLTETGGVYTFVRNDTETFTFNSTGQLTSIKDLNNYTTTLARPNSTSLIVTEPAGRTLSFTLASNRITGLTDPAGRTMAFSYDGSGNLTQVTDVKAGKWTFTYDGSHRMLTMREPKFFGDVTTTPTPVVTNHYDAQGRVDWQTDQLGRQTTFDYTTVPGSTRITDPRGNVTLDTYQYGMRTSHTKGYGTGQPSTWFYIYDPVTLGMTSVIDPNNRTTTMTYDSGGNRLTTTDALSHTTTVTYNALNLPLSVVDALGNTTNNTYTAAGNLLTSTQVRTEPNPDVNETTTYAYDPVKPGDVTSVTNPVSETTTFVYNTYGDLTSTTDATSKKTTFNYNTPTSIGWVTSSVAPEGNKTGGTPSQHTTVYERDAFGRVTATKDPMWSAGTPNDHRVTTTYDANGNVTSSTDGKGLVTNYAYNAANEPITTTRPDSTTLQNAYWPDGSLKTQIDGRTKVTNYAYDSQGRLTSTADALSRVTSYGYDAAGNLTTKVDPGGLGTTTFAYDNADRQTGINYSDVNTPDVTFGYDNANRRTSMVDGTGTSTYSYDSLSRLTASKNGANQTIGYGYDRANRQTTITYPGNKTVTRTFDNAGRMTAVLDWLGNNTQYTYDANGNLTNGELGNNIDTTTAYNRANQPINHKYNAGWDIAEFVANRNGAGQLTSTQIWGDLYEVQSAESYSYDQVSRLSSDNGQTAGYDNGDNPTTLAGGVTQTFDNGNQLATSTHDGSTTYAYDAKGNRTGSTPTAANSMATSLAYDQANRLKSANSNSAPPVTYEASVLADNPAGFWRMNDIDGVPIVDSSGNADDGSTSGWVNERLDGAVKGDPNNKSMAFWNYDGQAWFPYFPANTTTGQDTTVEFSMRWDGNDGTEAPFTFGSEYGLKFANGHFGFSTKADGSDIYGVSAAPLEQKWTHVVAVFRNGSVTGSKLYIDGVLQTLTQRQGTPVAKTVDEWGTASGNTTADQNFNGRLDELSVYGTALSQARVTAHYKALNSYSATYSYDGNGLRQQKNVNGTVSNFTWDVSGGLPQLLNDGENHFVYGADGMPLAQIDANDNTTWFAHDTQGNTRMLLRNDGYMVAAFDYDAYGNANKELGQFDTQLKFNGQYEDEETGFIYLRARYHDPKTNQFITVDPIVAQTRSAYGYAANDGINGSDPSGLFDLNPLDYVGHDGGSWMSNPTGKAVHAAVNVSRQVNQGVSGAWNSNVGSFDYGTTAAAGFNVIYGVTKVAVGVPAVIAGASAMVVPGAQVPATGVTMFGAYNVVSGGSRAIRGVGQGWGIASGDRVCTAVEQTAGANVNRFAAGVAPDFTSGWINALGGLP